MCSTLRPRSSTRVFNPFSQSSFAAHPPVMPEPITMASKVFCCAPFKLRLAVDELLSLLILLSTPILITLFFKPQSNGDTEEHRDKSPRRQEARSFEE